MNPIFNILSAEKEEAWRTDVTAGSNIYYSIEQYMTF